MCLKLEMHPAHIDPLVRTARSRPVSNPSDLLANVPPHILRPMTPADLSTVRDIDREAFETYRRQHGQLQHRLPLRTLANMRAALDRPFPGVIIEWPKGQPAGYCFTHLWGSVGWLGTLGVRPRKQGYGLGKAVIAGGLGLLREAGCSTLALETMPESGKNLAVYTRLGLDVGSMTLLLRGESDPARETHFDLWDGENENALRAVTNTLVPGLDPTPAAQWLAAERAGDTLVWHDGGQPFAFAIVRHAPRRDASRQTHLTVEMAACAPDAADRWPQVLAELQNFARGIDKAGLLLPVNAAQAGLLRGTLETGLHIMHTRVRMARGAPLGGPDAVLLMTLAM
jgi:ribosomal protein S18 acetylase RimI-like enzyme